MSRYEEGILRSLRRIMRSTDLYSRQLTAKFGLTGPQLVSLRALQVLGPTTPSALARHVDLSQATVTGIVDRLEANGLVMRNRDSADRRRVTLTLTGPGRALLARAPSALHSVFLGRLSELPDAEQARIHETLERVVSMMGAEALDHTPLLSGGASAVTDALLDSSSGPSPTTPSTPAAPSADEPVQS